MRKETVPSFSQLIKEDSLFVIGTSPLTKEGKCTVISAWSR